MQIRLPRDQVGTTSTLGQHQVTILRTALAAPPVTELVAAAGRKDRTKFRHQVLRPTLDAGWIEMTIPDKPTSRNQRYRTTPTGRTALAVVEAGGKGDDIRWQGYRIKESSVW